MKSYLFKHELHETSAVFGRTKDVKVVFKGEDAYTDGSTINIPQIDDLADIDKGQQRIMRGYVDHEAGHLRHSDMPFLMDRYEKWVKSGKEGLKVLQNSFEDIWLERRVMNEYVGSMKNFRALNDSIAPMEEEFLSSPKVDNTAINADTLSMAVRYEGRKDYTDKDLSTATVSKLNEDLGPWAEKIVEEIHKCSNSQEVTRVAKAAYKLLEEDPSLESNPEDFDPSKGDQVQDGGGEGEPTEAQKTFGQQMGDDTIKAHVEAGDVLEEMAGGFTPAEGDYVGPYSVWTTEHDKLIFEAQSSGDSYESLKSALASEIALIKTKLRRALLSKIQRDWDFGREVGRLDSKRLVAAKLGATNVYKQRIDREDMDTAVFLLVDQSGSMSGEKIHTARACALALGEALEGTGVQYAVGGFQTGHTDRSFDFCSDTPYHRIDSVRHYYHKPFEKSLRSRRKHIAGISSGGGNADRDALMWALYELSKREEKRKVLVVLSDGCPASATWNVGYDELTRHCKLVVDDAMKNGFEVVGIGIEDSSVTQIYKNVVVVDSVQDFARTYFTKFTNLLLKGK